MNSTRSAFIINDKERNKTSEGNNLIMFFNSAVFKSDGISPSGTDDEIQVGMVSAAPLLWCGSLLRKPFHSFLSNFQSNASPWKTEQWGKTCSRWRERPTVGSRSSSSRTTPASPHVNAATLEKSILMMSLRRQSILGVRMWLSGRLLRRLTKRASEMSSLEMQPLRPAFTTSYMTPSSLKATMRIIFSLWKRLRFTSYPYGYPTHSRSKKGLRCRVCKRTWMSGRVLSKIKK